MPAATHRIELNHDAHSDLWPWDYTIVQLATGHTVKTGYAESREEAEADARKWIAAETAAESPAVTLYTDDRGEDAEPVAS